MRFVFHFRPLSYSLRRHWYGLRVGAIWAYKLNGKAFLLDIGCISLGLVRRLKETK